MELAKVMAKGQVTIPINVRKKLNLKEGDKLIFVEKDGNMVIANSAMIALQQIQSAFEGEAERLGLKTEQDVVDLVDDVRREINMEKAGWYSMRIMLDTNVLVSIIVFRNKDCGGVASHQASVFSP